MAVEYTQEMVDLVLENKDKTDEDILGLLVQSGIGFRKVSGIYNKICIDQGLKMTKEQKDEKVQEVLSGFEVSPDTTPDDIAEQVEAIVTEIDCSAKAARGYVKKLFVDADIEMPKAPTGGGKRGPRTPGFGGDSGICANFLIANPECTRDEFQAHFEGLGRDKTSKGADKVAGWWAFIEDLKIFAEGLRAAGN